MSIKFFFETNHWSINWMCKELEISRAAHYKWLHRQIPEQEQPSMSRVGHCIDNGPTEGFWGIIKSEMFQMYEITDEASLRIAINDYMRFYSEERPQDRYHCKTPSEVRTEALSVEIPQEYPIAENKRIKKYKT